MYYDVVHVEPQGHLCLNVTFRDGTEGTVLFRESHLMGVFAALKNAELFNRVSCTHGFVEWPGNIDLAPDAMYAAIKQNGVWELY